jgi:hypothetical protein
MWTPVEYTGGPAREDELTAPPRLPVVRLEPPPDQLPGARYDAFGVFGSNFRELEWKTHTGFSHIGVSEKGVRLAQKCKLTH